MNAGSYDIICYILAHFVVCLEMIFRAHQSARSPGYNLEIWQLRDLLTGNYEF